MRYTRLATYNIVKGTFPELTVIAEKGLLPMFTREPGFVNYGLVDTGSNKLVSISIWETREEAQKSVNDGCNLGQGERLRPHPARDQLRW